MNGYIHSTESFGTVDGPGIRFVIFMQGCPMRCLYCHNPDTWKMTGGKEVTSEQLLNEYRKYKEFMRNGGITVTGGEPLLQLDFVIELFSKAKSENVHTCIDTSGITFTEENRAKFDELMKYTDLVMLDIKHIDDEAHKKLTGHSNERILEFSRYLRDKGVPLWVRHVVVPNLTDSYDDLFRLGEFLATLTNLKALDILPYHDMGKAKYKNLGMKYPLEDTPVLDKNSAEKAKNIVMDGIRSGLRKQRNK